MSSGPTQDKDPIQTYHDMKAKEGTAVLLNMAGLLRQFDRCWGRPTQLWMVFLGDRAMQHRSREGGFGEIFILFAKHFMFSHFGRKFLPSKLDLIQIKSDKKPIPPLAPCGSGSGLRMVTPPASFLLLGSRMMAALYRSIQLPLQIQILCLWSTLLIQITPGLQMPFCLDLPSSSLLWSRGPTECKTKD